VHELKTGGKMTGAELREWAERQRRASLHAQIDALHKRFVELGTGTAKITWLRRIKLQRKIRRLEGELLQPMLLPAGKR
jgi:hypothetical protein